jgi:transposase
MTEVTMNGKRLIGVDVGKRMLDVAREGSAKVERHANEASAIAAFVRRLDRERDLVVFERTGGYERTLEAELAAAGVPWGVLHSRAVKAFREAAGIKAKTDAIDARLLRDYGRDGLDRGKLRLGRHEDVTFDALVARKRQLKALLHAETCRLDTAAVDGVRASIERTIAALADELAAIERALAAHVASDPQLGIKTAAMCTQTGVAELTAQGLLAELPELGRLDGKAITALGGLAPRVHRSGTLEKRRGLDPGRANVKVILFNPARAAMRFDPDMRTFCQSLRARGKPGKVIMVAVRAIQ